MCIILQITYCFLITMILKKSITQNLHNNCILGWWVVVLKLHDIFFLYQQWIKLLSTMCKVLLLSPCLQTLLLSLISSC